MKYTNLKLCRRWHLNSFEPFGIVTTVVTAQPVWYLKAWLIESRVEANAGVWKTWIPSLNLFSANISTYQCHLFNLHIGLKDLDSISGTIQKPFLCILIVTSAVFLQFKAITTIFPICYSSNNSFKVNIMKSPEPLTMLSFVVKHDRSVLLLQLRLKVHVCLQYKFSKRELSR